MHLLLSSTDEFMGKTYIAAPGKRSRVQQLMYGRKRATDGAERGASDTRVTQMKQMWCVSASYRCTPAPATRAMRKRLLTKSPSIARPAGGGWQAA